jgi:hypothetical protein
MRRGGEERWGERDERKEEKTDEMNNNAEDYTGLERIWMLSVAWQETGYKTRQDFTTLC